MTKPKDTKWGEELKLRTKLMDIFYEAISRKMLMIDAVIEVEKIITQTQQDTAQDTVQDIIKDANNHMETSEDKEIRNFWYQVTVWLETIKKVKSLNKNEKH